MLLLSLSLSFHTAEDDAEELLHFPQMNKEAKSRLTCSLLAERDNIVIAKLRKGLS